MRKLAQSRVCKGDRRSQLGLTLVETMVSITIFAMMTIGIVPLLGVAMRGGAQARTESVGRNVAAKALERLRGLQYHVAYSSTPRRVDLLDHFFPATTPAYSLPGSPTGYDASTKTFITTCDAGSTAPACKALPGGSEIPAGYTITIRATFRDLTSPTTAVAVPADYVWNAAADKDVPPSKLMEVSVEALWTVGASPKRFALMSYLGDRPRVGPASSGGGPPPPPPPPAGETPETIKLRSEARIDYAVEATTTYQDTQATPRKTDFKGTMGIAQAYGEQLDSGSKADVNVSGGIMSLVRAADPLVPADTGYESTLSAATFTGHAPPDATGTTTVPITTNAGISQTEIPANAIGVWPASEAGTTTGLGGIGPKVTGGLPSVKGYYDFNSTSVWGPANLSDPNTKVHMVFQPQTPFTGALPADPNTVNPLNLYFASSVYKMFMVRDMDAPTAGADPRGEVEIHSTATTNPSTRVVYSKAEIVNGGVIMVLPTYTSQVGNRAAIEFQNFKANVTCNSKADPSFASTATGSWSATLRYYSDDTNNNSASYVVHQTTLPTQTLTDSHVPMGNTNPLAHLKTLNGGNGPLVHDNRDNNADVYMFAGNGKRGLIKDWSQGAVQTSISADDRVASAQLNGAIRLETSLLVGPWGASTKPEADMTVSIGKLSCKAEDYR